ncbi:hypothetical protein QUA54_05390 [Microcoleus sp. MOSTC5]|uniref:hypothetical protein n=1 Tax=Microcoleus sp. MOSTC5 TaxID=3055378 RepID=UPI002FD407AF
MPNAADTNIAQAVRQVAHPLTVAASDCDRYFFKLHALDRRSLDIAPGASSEDVLQAVDARVLDAAELMGRYGRANF